MVIHGFYHWRPRRIAFRNDFCRACAAERLSVLIRTLDVLHIYWIPVLPVGLWSRWYCTACGSRPHAATRTRRGFKVAGAFFLGLMALLAWAVPIEPADEAWMWGIRLSLSLFTVGLAVWAFQHPQEPRFQEVLAGVKPFVGGPALSVAARSRAHRSGTAPFAGPSTGRW